MGLYEEYRVMFDAVKKAKEELGQCRAALEKKSDYGWIRTDLEKMEWEMGSYMDVIARDGSIVREDFYER